jgi:hypothetical protein
VPLVSTASGSKADAAGSPVFLLFRTCNRHLHAFRPARERGIYVIGSSGTGKSQLLANMALQDIEAGHGLRFIDPHGVIARGRSRSPRASIKWKMAERVEIWEAIPPAADRPSPQTPSKCMPRADAGKVSKFVAVAIVTACNDYYICLYQRCPAVAGR